MPLLHPSAPLPCTFCTPPCHFCVSSIFHTSSVPIPCIVCTPCMHLLCTFYTPPCFLHAPSVPLPCSYHDPSVHLMCQLCPFHAPFCALSAPSMLPLYPFHSHFYSPFMHLPCTSSLGEPDLYNSSMNITEMAMAFKSVALTFNALD